jgi:hypothetical protein
MPRRRSSVRPKLKEWVADFALAGNTALVRAPQIFVGPTQRKMPAALFNNTQARLEKQPVSEGGPCTRKKDPDGSGLSFSILVFHFF